MITVSLNEILDAGACKDGFLRALCARGKITAEQCDELINDEDIDGADELPEEILNLADDEQFAAASVVTAEYISDAIWALRIRPEHQNLWRKYAIWCARQVQHLMTDERSRNALDVAWRHADGQATDEELNAARAAADAAARETQTEKLIDILTAGGWVD
ncbi:hypothetical protein [Dickeya dianthicola]|uniref:hypothetical protein n=1 Tax=Dickeya dianthicola TaxID=204039 RepID=UPI0018DFEA11|nr:hypothetical protein [Dickeya dianthicola]MBI0460489.1 hypothetical protein [Dickeya dianthicola]